LKTLAVIPARGGSKGIHRKNITPMLGKPLIAWTIDAALGAKYLDRVIVSTDDEEIARISRSLGVEVPFLRPDELSKDSTPSQPVLQHAVEYLQEVDGYKADIIMTLQPTSPLRRSEHIDEAIELFSNVPSADSLVSCVEIPHIFNPESIMVMSSDGFLETYLPENIKPTRRQQKEIKYARNGAIYMTRIEHISSYIRGGNVLPFIMKFLESIDIDTPDDLILAEAFMKIKH